MFIIAIRRPGKGDPVRMVWSTYYSASIFIGGTQYSINKCLQWFLNKNNIKIFIYFQYRIYKISVLLNIL